jgi:hypothetical protein
LTEKATKKSLSLTTTVSSSSTASSPSSNPNVYSLLEPSQVCFLRHLHSSWRHIPPLTSSTHVESCLKQILLYVVHIIALGKDPAASRDGLGLRIPKPSRMVVGF